MGYTVSQVVNKLAMVLHMHDFLALDLAIDRPDLLNVGYVNHFLPLLPCEVIT